MAAADLRLASVLVLNLLVSARADVTDYNNVSTPRTSTSVAEGLRPREAVARQDT